MGKQIKFFDIYNQDKNVHSSFIKILKNHFKNSDFILGKSVNLFENNFSKFTKSKYSIGCANGTDALYLALKSLNLPKNSEVIVPAMTWISTVLSILNNNLKPILVDVNKNDALISLKEIKKKINKNTKVILPVNLYGGVVNIQKIKKIIGNKKIFIIEDSAQAHGGKDDNGNNIGKFSDLACYSFYPGKNLGCYGDGGMITTNNKKYYERLIRLRNLGSKFKHKHEMIGVNSRLDTIQASLLNLKIKSLRQNNLKRTNIANIYKKKIKNKKIDIIQYSKFAVYHQYVILVKNRNKLITILDKNNIQYGIHYPISINKLDCFKNIFKGENFVNAEFIASHCLSLPIDPNLRTSDQKRICSVLNSY